MNIRLLPSLSLSLILVALMGCGATVKPFQSKSQINNLSYDEELVWHQSKEFEDGAQKANHLYPNEELKNYLQEIMDKLYPDYKGTIRVEVLKSPSYNAFALPNGAVYINLGLLGALENEAQVASVLGHEGAHFIQKHGVQQYQSAQTANVINTMLAASIPIAGLLSSIATTSSMYGYSRDAERESDKIGFDRLVEAGYKPDAAAEAMRKLLQEVKDIDADEPFFFASHPKLKSRIESFESLSSKVENAGSVLGKERYQKFTSAILLDSAQLLLDFGKYKSVNSLMSNKERMARYGGAGHYFLAEAQRKLSDAEKEEVIANYLKAIEEAPNFAKSYRSLGLLYYKNGQKSEAKKHLEKYLELDEFASDKRHIQFYLNKLK